MSNIHTDSFPPVPARGNAPFDIRRVEALRSALREGTYRIDARRIADRLIALEKSLP